ncbi:uncharacterized protein EI97DRAFT_449695 [Westerdykella ornata]|uniref:Intramembrane protease 2 n=1 Tax=Westerdykella ornata TaxID=318751 RepID=A0A6A6JN20_WESOR|nr:uncharacterized protein EI97DRAFT_449695 [Westerdykella ornata]KAF2277625.1 hypothetical protein EI97DRAFT_449695 [Westerdykella ornata]
MADTEPGLLAQIAGRVAYDFTLLQPMIPLYVHLLLSALFPIYAGAHASLTRPSSAAKSKKRSGARVDEEDVSSEDEDEEDDTRMMEGLSPSDAIVFPLLAGTTLAGLYYLIKWLEDPALLNKILNWYFAFFGAFSVARLINDLLDIGHSLIFPRRYALDGTLYHVHGKAKKAVPVAGSIKDKGVIDSPLPGFLARIPLPSGIRELLWSDRAMPGNKWTVRVYLHRVFAGKVRIGPHAIVSSLLSVAAVAYFNFVDKPWYLTNLMGFGFAYGALQLMSPTTFATGSLILSALFFYDIYFVFFTPMMVSVATSLDVPIKLMFPRPSPADAISKKPSHAMLGLGDIVLPGIMMGLALRFDLYLFYLRQQRRIPATEEGGKEIVEKPTYFSLAGRWSDHFWTHSLSGRPLFTTSSSKPEAPFTFPKTYFTASVVGYIAGMMATLYVMHVWQHAQPALLYLVPGVLGSLWLTALIRGEVSLMWNYSEVVEEEGEADHKTTDKEGGASATTSERSSFFSLSDKKAKEREARFKNALGKHVRLDDESGDEGDLAKDQSSDRTDRVKQVAGHKSDREVFSFSIEAPWKLKHPRFIRRQEKHTDGSSAERSPLEKGKPHWAPPTAGLKAEEPAGKRIRLN